MAFRLLRWQLITVGLGIPTFIGGLTAWALYPSISARDYHTLYLEWTTFTIVTGAALIAIGFFGPAMRRALAEQQRRAQAYREEAARAHVAPPNYQSHTSATATAKTPEPVVIIQRPGTSPWTIIGWIFLVIIILFIVAFLILVALVALGVMKLAGVF